MTSRYEHLDFFLLRAPAQPVGSVRALLGDESPDPDAARARLRERLRAEASDPDVRRALTVASPDLAGALDRLDRDPDATDKKTRRVYSRLLRYLVRSATRPTPFGAFSAVALGRFGDATTARLGPSASAGGRVRVDMAWLLALVKKLEGDPEIRRHLRVRVNASAHVRGDRVLLPYADVYGEQDNRAVTIRATPAVDTVLRLASAPVTWTHLVDGLAAEFPDVDRDRVVALVDEMWNLNFLLSDLRPPLTTPVPEQHVVKQLADVPVAGVADSLEDVTERARAAADGPSEALAELAASQRALVPDHTGPTYQLDTKLDLRDGVLSHAVGRVLADAVDCLMRLSAAVPGHHHHLVRYREAFTERYGQNALVPVLEVLSPEHGLDAPPTYTEPPRAYPLPPFDPPDPGPYDRVLTELVAEAWWDGGTELELTDERLARLLGTAQDDRDRPVYPALDVYAQLQVSRPGADLDSEPWRAVLREEVLAYGGRTYGRFHDLLGEQAVDTLRGLTRREEALNAGVVHAELCYLPSQGRAANVTLRPALREYEIPLNVTPSVPQDRVLALDDLFVGVTEDRFYLWSRRLGREVRVSQGHMLSAQLAPNVARFLLEASDDGYVMPSGFRWGALAGMPFLPRVVRGQVVLRPAEWTLDRTAGDDDALAGWRERWRVPRHVYLLDDDNRLLLDLDHPSCRDELRTELARGHGRVTVQEMLPGADENWLTDESGRGYLSEIVVPLVARDAADTARTPPPPTAQDCDLGNVRTGLRHPPGSEWTFLKIYAPFAAHDEIIASSLREQASALRAEGLVDRWFYLRYADPWPHLRVRFRGAGGATPPELLAHLTAWGASLVEQGLAHDTAVATYAPEVERYGGPVTFDAVERLFEANSDVTAELVSMLRHEPDGIQAQHVALAAVHALYAQWGVDPITEPDLLPLGADPAEVRAEFREHRDYLGELLAPWDERPHERGRAHHERLAPVLAAQAGAAAGAARAVADAEARKALWGNTASVLGSLAHMQVNRLMEIDLHRESRCYALWRLTTNAVRGRPAHIHGE